MGRFFKSVKPEALRENPFRAIGKEWMLIAAGRAGDYNMMTASWGAWGVLWHKPVCFCFIRPHRHTYGYVEKNDFFALNFFDKKYKKALDFCGSHSGRDVDKARETRLTPLQDRTGCVYFAQARLVIVCRKIYFQEIDPAHFLDTGIQKNYPKKDYHRMYAGEIIRVLKKS